MEEACCGSGCVNCVLDQKISVSRRGKKNILSSSYSQFVLKSVKKRSWNVMELEFQHSQASEDLSLEIPPGSSLMLRTPKSRNQEGPPSADLEEFCVYEKSVPFQEDLPRPEKHDRESEDVFISRFYTPIDFDSDRLSFRVLVKLEPHGQMTQRLKQLRVSDCTEWKGPYSKVPDLRPWENLIFVSQGVAISTIYSLCRQLLEDDTCDAMIKALACFRDSQSILLRDELIRLNGYWNFQSSIFLAHDPDPHPRPRFGERLTSGRLGRENLVTGEGCEKTLFLICGSSAFSEKMGGLLSDFHVHML